MSENKDLETIKELTDNLKDLDIVLDKYDLAEKVIAVATRMAAEIERLKTDNAGLLKEIKRLANVLKANNIDNFVPVIPHLVEVVRCGECKKWHTFFCNFAYDDANLTDNDFCSAGVRRESEEQNDKM